MALVRKIKPNESITLLNGEIIQNISLKAVTLRITTPQDANVQNELPQIQKGIKNVQTQKTK